MNTKTQKISAIIASFVMVASVVPYATAQNFQTTGTFGVCSATFNAPGGINYGLLEEGVASAQLGFLIDNDGDFDADVNVLGANWVDAGLVKQMDVFVTEHSSSNGFAHGTGTDLSLVNVGVVSGLTPSSTHTEYFNVQPVKDNPAFVGDVTQDVTFSFACP